MPCFFFHVYDHAGVQLDLDGRELPDLAMARREAIKGVRSILSYEVNKGLIDLTGRIEVADARGTVVITIGYAETVTMRTA